MRDCHFSFLVFNPFSEADHSSGFYYFLNQKHTHNLVNHMFV